MSNHPPSLDDPSLLRDRAFIDGAWCDSDAGARFDVFDPADGKKLGSAPDMGPAETQRAIAAAEAALPEWSARTGKERAALLRRWSELVLAHADDLARLMTAEQGKPLAEAAGEVTYAAAFLEWFAEEAKRVSGEVLQSPARDRRIVTLRQPVGVVASITPWNFPLAMITRKVGPALAAGCTVVSKPAEDTPLSALALAELAARSGLPAGVFNVVTGADPAAIGRELTASRVVRKLSFTGSTAVGKLLLHQCADTVKKVTLELGGNAPFIVFDDADLEVAVEAAIASKYRNAGQTCVCANRIFVQASVYDAFCDRYCAAVAALRVGAGAEAGAQIGPLINATAVEKVERLVADAIARGARSLVGGKRHARGERFYEPTVLGEATPEMDCSREEIFGPVSPLYRFESEADAIALANATPFGLAAYFCARDLSRVWRVAEALEVGIVGVNEGIISSEVAPFGGVKESGIGREGGAVGIEEYLETKYVCFGGIS